ncbi:hypothetical protein Dsin_014951 [Dipteronia sinensis]|uniref:Uncharacterized protein n=1 Tax=Dipteronia sinensis TaxID=43782 RepID=A0AAE0AMW5_9ROSI|nr:hypothetical protein Dsin_014951 [Dipteronia sinensis]
MAFTAAASSKREMKSKFEKKPTLLGEKAGKKSCCIFRVCQSLVEINQKAYHPVIVSIARRRKKKSRKKKEEEAEDSEEERRRKKKKEERRRSMMADRRKKKVNDDGQVRPPKEEENQIPYFVLEKLFEISVPNPVDTLQELILKFFSFSLENPVSMRTKHLHLLDLVRESFRPQSSRSQSPPEKLNKKLIRPAKKIG